MTALLILGGVASAASLLAVLFSRWPVSEEVKAVVDLIDHDGGDWAQKGDEFTNKKAQLTVRDWTQWTHGSGDQHRIELKGVIARKWIDTTWAERRALRAAMRRWEVSRIQDVVIKALED